MLAKKREIPNVRITRVARFALEIGTEFWQSDEPQGPTSKGGIFGRVAI